jgi:hypothetical protein
MRDESGQALVEVATVLPILAFAITGALWLLRAGALRAECTRVVFEAVRAQLEVDRERGPVPNRNGVVIRVREDGVEGELTCGNHFERIFLPHLGKRNAGA